MARNNEKLASPYDLNALAIERKREREKRERCCKKTKVLYHTEAPSPYDLGSIQRMKTVGL